MADAMKLLPCPMCGGEAALLDYEARYGGLHYASRCPQCASCGCSMGYLPTAKKAVEAWNCRTYMPTPEKAPSFDDARRKLIHCIEQWDGETEYDAEDIAALADDILDVFASPPAREEAPAERTYTDEEILRDTVPADLLEAEIRRLQEFAYDAQDMNLEIAASNNYPDAPGALASDLLAVLSERACKPSPIQVREAPAEGAGELSVICQRMADDYQTSDTHHPNHVLLARADFQAMTAALRNRTSEPEAGAVAWRARMRPDGEWMVLDAEYVPGRSADDAVEVQPLYTHPAPATADKLKVAKEALEPFDAVMIDVGQGEDDDDLFRNADRTYARAPAITVGHIRRAAAALATLNEQPQ